MSKFKAFIILGAVAYAIAQGYVWSHDTSFTEIKDGLVTKMTNKKNEVVDGVTTSVKETKDDIVNSTKKAVKEGFDKSAQTIGIDTRSTAAAPLNKAGKPDEKSTEKPKESSKEKLVPVALEYQVKFKYDHTGAPEGVSEKDMLKMVENASKVWEQSCGVKFVMDGTIRSDYIAVQNDGTSNKSFGIIRWSELSGDTLGQAHLGGPTGPVGDFIMDLNKNAVSSSQGVVNQESLQAALVHELGHVLGLDHSRLPESVMHAQQKTFNTVLNKGDSEMCRATVVQWEKNPSNKKFKV